MHSNSVSSISYDTSNIKLNLRDKEGAMLSDVLLGLCWNLCHDPCTGK